MGAPDLTAESVGFALSVAARCADATRKDQAIELAWTGPRVATSAPRRTDQARLVVINAATSTLTIVSFVAYKVPVVARALAVRAGDRVARGQRIGTVGTTGQRAWPGFEHVHLELQRGRDPRDVEDPRPWLAGCFDPAARDPADRLMLTCPVTCASPR